MNSSTEPTDLNPSTRARVTKFYEYRKDNNINARELARRAGITPQRIYQLDRTGECPSATASALAQAMAEMQDPPADPAQVFAACFFLESPGDRS